MKKNAMIRVLFLLLILLSLACPSVCEEAGSVPGNIPERGLILPMTQEDVAMGIHTRYTMASAAGISSLPLLDILYTDTVGAQAVLDAYAEKYTQEEILGNEELFYQFFMDLYANQFPLYQVALFEASYITKQTRDGKTLAQAIGAEDLFIIGENDGYTYAALNISDSIAYESEELKAHVLAAAERANELLQNAEFQPITFAPGEITMVPNGFPVFSTQDLAGNTVTNDIFSGKDLTVVNVWGTFCNPCINEMPDLAQWSASMPENVQLIGLVSDLSSTEDADTLELAKAICEATGASYPSLIAGEDFQALLSGVVGVPTTFFIDGSGAFVGEPVVGANVPACKAFVEEYFANK